MASDKAVDSASIQELLQQLTQEKDSVARDHLKKLIEDASQPRHTSGNSCIKLCYFLEQCRKFDSSSLRDVAYSRETCQDLFDFYVEWNEKNQHRSMRQVLELLGSLISLNPDKTAANAFKSESLNRLISIITHQSAQPLVKPAFKMLECFLAKGTFSISELFEAYNHVSGNAGSASRSEQDTANITQWDQFVSDVFEWMSLPDTASAAGKLLVSLFVALKTSPIESLKMDKSYSTIWQRWVQQGLGKHPESLENVKNYLFPALFKLDRLGSLEFLRNLSNHNTIDAIGNQEVDSHASLLLSAMEVGKKLGLVDDPDIIPPQKASAKRRDFVELPSKVIGNLLTHTATTVRSSAFSVLVLSLSSTRPFPKESLDAIRQNLYVLHADTDAKFRNELFTNTKHLLERLRGALALLYREMGSNETRRLVEPSAAASNVPESLQKTEAKGDDLQKYAQEHESFLSWYLNFLGEELVPTASYQRHITSLRSLEVVLRTGLQTSPSISATNTSRGSDTSWPKQINIFSPSLCRLLLDLVLDPFEEVRNCSVSVLNFAPKACFGQLSDTPYGPVPQLLQDLVSKAKMASARTGRADLADGLASTFVLEFKFFDTNEQRLYFFDLLLQQLEGDVARASEDLELAADMAPIHGQLATIRQVWDLIMPSSYEGIVAKGFSASGPNPGTIEAFQNRLVACCIDIWKVVKDTLCNDSPEGQHPKGPLTVGDVDVKSILSYSFRACHESSELIQAIIRKLTVKSSEGTSFLTFDLFQQVGNLTFEQLSCLRHRGAFSTVATTFTQCCKLTQHVSIAKIGGADLLFDWYNRALTCINEQHSTTRRSAGIPALITGILSASSSIVTFDSVMMKLQGIARAPVVDTGRDEVQLPQVHAMNSLKDIFKSATLGKRADIYVTGCFLIAADSLKSKNWAISNCGLLLIKSLIDCMLGTSESKVTAEAGWDGRSIRISYDRYKNLPDLLLRLLSLDIGDGVDAKEVFPALEFVRRVGPPEKDRTQFREKFFGHIIKHLNCPTWDVRDLAARTACTFLLDDDWKLTIINLLNSNPDSTNWLHGVLLLIKYLLNNRLALDRPTSTGDLFELLQAMSLRCLQRGDYPTNQILLAAYEEALFPVYCILSKDMPPKTDPIFSFLTPEWKGPADDALKSILAATGHEMNRNPNYSADASLAKAQAVHILYIMRLENTMSHLFNGNVSWDGVGEDIVVEILDRIFDVFDFPSVSKVDFISLVGFLQHFVRDGDRSERVRTAALKNISFILESQDFDLFSDDQISQLLGWLINHDFLDSSYHYRSAFNGPEFTNAMLNTRGLVLRLNVHAYTRLGSSVLEEQLLGARVHFFGCAVLAALRSDNDFDTRLAAVTACHGFYNSHADLPFKVSAISTYLANLLPLNLALMDSLTDDDDDIRSLGARTLSYITLRAEVPEAAAQNFSLWLLKHYNTSYNFRDEALRRITRGNAEPGFSPRIGDLMAQPIAYPSVAAELAAAMVDDNALFAEEEHNLYVDEVRETKLWTGVLGRGRGELWDEAALEVGQWGVASLRALSAVAAERQDGPFGWVSKPEVFAICARVVLAAKAAVVRMGAFEGSGVLAEEVVGAGKELFELGSESGFHPLLLEEVRWFVERE